MKEMGGYFGLELAPGEALRGDALALNSGRSCLVHLLRRRGVRRLHLPRYICDSVVDAVSSAGVETRFHSIDGALELERLPELEEGERLLYVDYFGLKRAYVELLARRYGDALIVDNSQAFFTPPLPGIGTFYSPRKFFGVADGGYLYGYGMDGEGLATAHSAEHSLQLLGRIDEGAEAWFDEYRRAEAAIARQGVMAMSPLTEALLGAVDYRAARERREANYDYLAAELGSLNRLSVAAERGPGPMVYPFIGGGKHLRENLLENRIYTATYWQEARGRDGVSEWERTLVDECVPLPVDQRYDSDDMRRMVGVIKEVLNG